MLLSMSVKPNSRVEGILFFKETDFTVFENKVIPLFGPNGIGKSTLIQAIKSKKEIDVKIGGAEGTVVYSYENGTDNFKIRRARSYAESFDPVFMLSKLNAQSVSEGQSIIYSMFDLLDALYPGKPLDEKEKDTLVLLDEIDSGLSIDNIDITMRKIKYIVRKRDNVQFIFSFNSPRVLKHFPEVLSMYDGTKIELHTDEDMLAEIRKHKKEFDKARKYSNGRPKIYE